MVSLLLSLFPLLVFPLVCHSKVIITEQWEGGFQAKVIIPISEDIDGWNLTLDFDEPMSDINIWDAKEVSKSDDGLSWNFESMIWNRQQDPGSDLELSFVAKTESGDVPQNVVVLFNDELVPEPAKEIGVSTVMSVSPTQVPTGSPSPIPKPKYDYEEVLEKSILFYEAQRSGKLPPDNRVPWRGDSALTDGEECEVDLSGGWYDAGDHVKFNFPMASSTTVLLAGLLEFKDAYIQSGQHTNMLKSVRWPLDYFLKCHTKDNELYGQVGKGDVDHAVWTRPEDMETERPCYKIHTGKPGSDLAAETAAAMAAGYLVFENDGMYCGGNYSIETEPFPEHSSCAVVSGTPVPRQG